MWHDVLGPCTSTTSPVGTCAPFMALTSLHTHTRHTCSSSARYATPQVRTTTRWRPPCPRCLPVCTGGGQVDVSHATGTTTTAVCKPTCHGGPVGTLPAAASSIAGQQPAWTAKAVPPGIPPPHRNVLQQWGFTKGVPPGTPFCAKYFTPSVPVGKQEGGN